MLITLSDHCQQSHQKLLSHSIGSICTFGRLLVLCLQKFFEGSSVEFSQRRAAVSVALKCADFSKITSIEVDEINTDNRGKLVIALSITHSLKGVFTAKFMLDSYLMIESVISREQNNENNLFQEKPANYYDNYIVRPFTIHTIREDNQPSAQAASFRM